jgi:hypothetical protein
MFRGGGLVRRPGDIASLDSLSVWWVEDSDDKFLGLSPLGPRVQKCAPLTSAPASRASQVSGGERRCSSSREEVRSEVPGAWRDAEMVACHVGP